MCTESAHIKQRRDAINQLWSDLRELTDARTQALASAKEIHTFDRDAADCKERIQVGRQPVTVFIKDSQKFELVPLKAS